MCGRFISKYTRLLIGYTPIPYMSMPSTRGQLKSGVITPLLSFYNFWLLILKLFPTTLTLENAIAKPAKIGLSIQPKIG